jgi:hypothetical protein
MIVKKVKRKDGNVGYMVGEFTHSDKRMAEIGLPFAIQRERERILRAKEEAERLRLRPSYQWCVLSKEDELLLAPTPASVGGVVPVPNTIVDGAEFSPEEVRQMRRLRSALISDPDKYVKARDFIVAAKRNLGPLNIELNHESVSKLIAQCS